MLDRIASDTTGTEAGAIAGARRMRLAGRAAGVVVRAAGVVVLAARGVAAAIGRYGMARVSQQYHRLDQAPELDNEGPGDGEVMPKALQVGAPEASNTPLLDWVTLMKRVDPLAGVTVFLTVAELKSFAAAAARLRISASTVSSQIADLEERLGVRLVHRTTRHVTLTEAGQAYFASLDGLLAQAERGSDLVGSFKDDISGTLRIAAPFDADRWLLGPVIERFRREHPQLTVDLQVSHGIDNLVERGFDLAIRGTHMLEPNWIVRKLRTVNVFVAASPAYLAGRRMPERPQDISALDCIHYSGLSFGSSWLLRRGAESESVAIRPAMLSNAGSTLRNWALEGHGLVLLPDFYIGEDIAAGRLMRVLPDWQAPGFDLNMVYPDNKHISRKVKLFVDYTIEATRVGGAA